MPVDKHQRVGGIAVRADLHARHVDSARLKIRQHHSAGVVGAEPADHARAQPEPRGGGGDICLHPARTGPPVENRYASVPFSGGP